MNLPASPLEDWLRDYYFTAKTDISSSGVEPYGFAEVRERLGITVAELDSVRFSDSRSTGDPRLRRAIAERYGDGDPDRVMAANGSSETLFLVLNTVLGPGDEVVVPGPAYHSLTAIAGAIGCRLVRWPLRPDRGFRPDLDELAGLVSGQTRAIIVNFPHNPTGVSLSAAELGRLTGIAGQAGAYLIWDGAFTDLTYGAPPLPDPSTRYERAITFGTLSKSYGLPGLRVGWCIAPPAVIADCIRWRDYITLALSPLVEFVAIRAVSRAEALLRPRLEQARRNLGLVAGWMADHEDLVGWAPPDGGVTAFPRLRGVGDVEAFCHWLMRDHGVLTVPGTCFGVPGHIRLGFGGGTAELRQGLAAMSELLRARR